MNRRDMLKNTILGSIALASVVEASITQHKNRAIMKPKDALNPTKAELKHLPQIKVLSNSKDAAGYNMVEITVGQSSIIHPSISTHWIDFIELYADGKLVGKSVLEAGISRGMSVFSVKLDGVKELQAKAGCNLHGIWTSKIDL
jgi:superoxide reductase